MAVMKKEISDITSTALSGSLPHKYRGKTDLVEINATQAYTPTGTTYYIVVDIHNAHSRLDDLD